MTSFRLLPAIQRLIATVSVASTVAVAAAVSLLMLQSTAIAVIGQTSGKSGPGKSTPNQAAGALAKRMSGSATAPATDRWTSATRSRRIGTSAGQTPAIQLTSGHRSTPPDGAPSSASTVHVEDSTPGTALQPPAENAAPVAVKPPTLLAKERLKQAIDEQRRTRQAFADPGASMTERSETNSSPAMGNLVPVPEQPSVFSDSSEQKDRVEQAKAARFLLLKLQLEQLKSKLRESEKGQPRAQADPSLKVPVDSAASTPSVAPNSSVDAENHQTTTSPAPATDGGSGVGQNTHAIQTPAEPDRSAEKPNPSAEVNQSISDDHTESPAAQDSTARQGFSAMPQHATVDGPIDRLGLANNLYAVGEYLLAMEMYEQTDPAEMTAQQQIWSEYQIANCLRRIGRKADASVRYRRLAAQPESGWLSVQSRWWVEVLERARQLENSLNETGPASDPSPLSSPLQSPSPALSPAPAPATSAIPSQHQTILP